MLPSSWVDELFARLSVRYGRAFLAQYGDLDAAAVKADWATELGGFRHQPEAIKHALENLPADKPPTVGQFRYIARGVPLPSPLALTEPRAPMPPEVAVVVAQSRRETADERTPAQVCLDNIIRIATSRGRMSVAQRGFTKTCRTMLRSDDHRHALLEALQ